MKQRAHVLHVLLKVCVHRADLKVLDRYLLPKTEYALKVRMSRLLTQLYRDYLAHSGHKFRLPTNEAGVARIVGGPPPKLFEAHTHLYKIWRHMGVLEKQREDMGRTAAERD